MDRSAVGVPGLDQHQRLAARTVGRTAESTGREKTEKWGENGCRNSNLRFEFAPRAWALRDQPAVARTRSTRTWAQASLDLPVGPFFRSIPATAGSEITRLLGGGLKTAENPAGNAPLRA